VDFRQLLPEPRTVELGDLTSSLGLDGRSPAERPYTVANFVGSVDGRATFGERSGTLGDDGDRAMFHGLRGAVDAVIAGTVTMRTERYGRVIGDADRRRRRVEAGLTPEPLAVIVTRSGDVPTDIPLFDEPEARVVVFTSTAVDLGAVRAQVELVPLDPGELTFVTVMRHLRAEHGVRSLLCEGGPTLFGALVREAVVDELFLTLAAKLTGGGRGPAISSGPELPEPTALRLIWALERAGSLYLRYRLS
jgi:riboflavin biosynthesis pyrimidine reductase